MLAFQAGQQRQHVAAGQVLIASHVNLADAQRLRIGHRLRRVPAGAAEHPDRGQQPRGREQARQPRRPSARRPHVRAPKPLVGRRRYGHDAIASTTFGPSDADRSGAHRQHQVARRRDARHRRRHVGKRLDDVDAASVGALHFFGQSLDRHARQRVLARRVDVGEHDLVGQRQRRTKLVQQLRGARIPVRLEHAHDAARAGSSRRAQHGRDLGRVVTVVVDDGDPACLAFALEPALGATKLRQGRRDGRKRHVQLQADADRGERVEHVVAARHLQRQRAQASRGQPLSAARWSPAIRSLPARRRSQ